MTLIATGKSAQDASVLSRDLPLVLIHGYLGGSVQWQNEVDALSRDFTVIAVDLPGFGHAAKDPSPATIGAFADHVLAALDARGVDEFVLLGHSMGGMIAQEIAHRAPARVARLVLYGTGPLGCMPDRFEPLEVSVERLAKDGVEKTARRIVATWFVEGEKHPGYRLLHHIGAETSAEAARSALQAMANWDGRSYLTRLGMPTLILWGDQDRSYRWPQVETLWKNLPNASLAVIPGASHVAHLEKPDVFMAILKDFLLR